MPDPQPRTERRIGIVGAGAAGLSAAYYLKRRGFQHVTVLEKADRVGGKCRSLWWEGRPYDVGARWVFPAYTEIRKLAAELGLRLQRERPFHLRAGGTRLKRLLPGVAAASSWWRLAIDYARFQRQCSRLRRWLGPTTFQGVSDCPELCGSFAAWLKLHRLTGLQVLFEGALTDLGYGPLDELPAVYGLKALYSVKRVGLISLSTFVDGYQELWERVAAGLDVRLNCDIRRIDRGERITCGLSTGEQLEFDTLILACPLRGEVLSAFLTLSPEEDALFSKVTVNPYVVLAHPSTGLRLPGVVLAAGLEPGLRRNTLMVQMYDDTPLVLFYANSEGSVPYALVQQDVEQLGGHLEGPYVEEKVWDYFPHVAGEDLAAGFYDRLEALQGQQNTYYCGGLVSFECVGLVARYSKELVDERLTGR